MMEVQPESRSLILRATHILVARLESADPKPWAPRPSGGEERMVHLELTVEEVVKGVVKQKPGDVVAIDVKQVKLGFAWGPKPGLWSNAPLDPKKQWVAFASTTSDDAGAVLNDPAGVGLLPVSFALLDVHLAAHIEGSRLDLAGAAALMSKEAPTLGNLSAEYLWERYGIGAMGAIDQFEIVASFLEDPKLSVTARGTLLLPMITAVRATDPPKIKHVNRLAITMFRLLATPEAQDLHNNLVSTHLPNLLDVTHDGARTADQVFEDYPGEKARAVQAVQAYKGSEATAPLLAWLGR